MKSFLKNHFKDIIAIIMIIAVTIAKYYKVDGDLGEVITLATGLFFGNRLGSKNHTA